MHTVIPAKQIAIPDMSIETSQANNQFRSRLVDIMYSDLYAQTSGDTKIIVEGSYKGTKSSQDGNDLMFLYRGADFVTNPKSVALILVRIGEGAKVNLYEIPAQNKKPAKYVVTIGDSSVCRALYVEKLVSSKQAWAFDVEAGQDYASCVENTSRAGFENAIVANERISDALSPVINKDDYPNSVKLIGFDKSKMETFANIVRSAFSNAD